MFKKSPEHVLLPRYLTLSIPLDGPALMSGHNNMCLVGEYVLYNINTVINSRRNWVKVIFTKHFILTEPWITQYSSLPALILIIDCLACITLAKRTHLIKLHNPLHHLNSTCPRKKKMACCFGKVSAWVYEFTGIPAVLRHCNGVTMKSLLTTCGHLIRRKWLIKNLLHVKQQQIISSHAF